MALFQTIYGGQLSPVKWLTGVVVLLILTFSFGEKAVAQAKIQMVRLAKIKVDPLQLDKYNVVLKE